MRDQETETALEEAEIRNLELQLQKKMFEQVMCLYNRCKKNNSESNFKKKKKCRPVSCMVISRSFESEFEAPAIHKIEFLSSNIH